MLDLLFRDLLLQPLRLQVCSPPGSFRTLTDRGFPPSRAATFKKKVFNLSGIAACRSRQTGKVGCAGGAALSSERRLPKAECQICDDVECEQFRIDVPSRRA